MEGLTIKSLKRFQGHNHIDYYRGVLHLGNKKIAEISEDGNNGPLDIRELDKERYGKFKKWLEDAGLTKQLFVAGEIPVSETFFLTMLLHAAEKLDSARRRKAKCLIFDKEQHSMIEYTVPYSTDPQYFDNTYKDKRYVILSAIAEKG